MSNMASDSIRDERRESLPLVRSSEQSTAGDKPSRKNPAEGVPSEQLEEAEQDAEDPTHEKAVPPDDQK
jgi:hypothetical protein